jgi:hypothetical protein
MESRNTDNQSVGDYMVMLDFIFLVFVFKGLMESRTQIIISVLDFWFMRDFNGLLNRVVGNFLGIRGYREN